MLIDDACTGYAELASIEPNAADQAYYQFVTLHWKPSMPPSAQSSPGSAARSRRQAT